MAEITTRRILVGDLALHVATGGPDDGPPVILLHGFPDAHFGWTPQIHALAEAGFRVIAPDQRGYNQSDKPKGRAAYRADRLVGDVLGLADALNIDRFDLAGHDFGAMVGWHVAAYHPDRLRHLAILNVPHPAVMGEFLRSNGEQRRRSWYIFFFQLPLLPELAVRALNWRMPANAMSDSLTDEDLDRYRAAWSQPGAITAMINWYRAGALRNASASPVGRITVPTLMIWGKRDPHLMWQMAPPSIALCDKGRLELIDDATHWVQWERPERVNRLLLGHFGDGL